MSRIALIAFSMLFLSTQAQAALTSSQEQIGRFVADSHSRQVPSSDYFKSDGGVSISKVAGNLGMTETQVLNDSNDMERDGYLQLTTRADSKAGLKATTALFTELQLIDAQKQQDMLTQASADFEKSEDARVTADFNRMKRLGLV